MSKVPVLLYQVDTTIKNKYKKVKVASRRVSIQVHFLVKIIFLMRYYLNVLSFVLIDKKQSKKMDVKNIGLVQSAL